MRSLLIVILAAACSPAALAQQTNTGVGNTTVGDSYYEFIGSNWFLRGKGWFMNFGGGSPGGGAAPPFGFPGGGGLNGGFGFGGGGVSGGLNFTAGQGSSRSISSTSGSITSLNGTPGFLFNGTLTPFITQIRPVVAERPVLISPLQVKLQAIGGPNALRTPLRTTQDNATPERSAPRESTSTSAGSSGGESSAERGDLSVAEIRRRQSSADDALQAELARLQAEAERLASAGDNRAAALCYSKAAAKVEGPQREEFLIKARELRKK